MSIPDQHTTLPPEGGRQIRSQLPGPIAAPDTSDPTFALRRKQANLCEAVMLRVIELETAGKAMLESAKKLRAAVMANT